jgi:hypothetical protein
MQKEDLLIIPPHIKSLLLGLGWDSKSDLDSSVLQMDLNGNLIDKAFYG